MDIKHIREISKKYTPEQIEGCITQQIETGKNMCLADETSEKIINELSKAEVVSELMDQGMDLADALRELARRIRLVQSGFKEDT
jgi:methyl coenzyme M reductase subunit D